MSSRFTLHRVRRRRLVLAGALAVAVAAGMGLALAAGAVAPATAARIAVGALGVIGVWFAAASLQDLTDRPDDDPDDAARSLVRARRRTRIVAVASRVFRTSSWRWQNSVLGGWAGLEQIVRFSEGSAIDFHVRLRPRIAAVVERRLAAAGIDPADRARVAGAVGELGAQIVDPDVVPPHDREAPGVPAVALRDLLRRADGLR